jgi:hypothetical protein
MVAPDPPLAAAIVAGTSLTASVVRKQFAADKAFRVLLGSFIVGAGLYAFTAVNAQFGAAMTWLVLIGALLLNGVPTITAFTGVK